MDPSLRDLRHPAAPGRPAGWAAVGHGPTVTFSAGRLGVRCRLQFSPAIQVAAVGLVTGLFGARRQRRGRAAATLASRTPALQKLVTSCHGDSRRPHSVARHGRPDAKRKGFLVFCSCHLPNRFFGSETQNIDSITIRHFVRNQN
jgi:hypothetical protein